MAEPIEFEIPGDPPRRGRVFPDDGRIEKQSGGQWVPYTGWEGSDPNGTLDVAVMQNAQQALNAAKTSTSTSSSSSSSEPGKAYASPQAAIDDLRPGWKVTGPGRPYYINETDPDAIKEGTTKAVLKGTTYPVQGPDGQPDEITLGSSDTKVVWNTDPGAPLPKALVIIKGPANQPTKPVTPIGQWTRLDANYQPLPAGSAQRPTYLKDPSSNSVLTVNQDAPSDPSQWTPIYDPNDTSQVNRRIIGLYDPVNGKPAATVPAPAGAKPTGVYDDVYVTDASGKKKLVAKVDQGDKTWHPVSVDPASQKRLIQTPTAVYSVGDDDKVTKLFDVDKTQPYQLANIDGVAYRFDPNESDPTKALIKLAPGQALPKSVTQNGVTWTLNPDTNKYELPPGVPRPTTMTGAGTSSEWLITYDATTGEEISRKKNPNWVKPAKNLPQPNAVVPYIQVEDDSPQGWHWEENKGQVTASDALKNLAGILSGQVVNGKITVEEAKSIIDGANTTMQNALTAANTQLDFVSKNAATGGGLLQQRAATAQGITGQILGLAGQGQHYGGGGGTAGLSGGMMAAPAGIGNLITQGASEYSAELLGGMDTINAAARMVQAADPNSNMFSPESKAAVGVLSQMFDKFHQLSGQPHPAVQAAAAGNQTATGTGMTVPQTTGAALGAVAQPFGPNFGGGQSTGSFGNAPGGFPAPRPAFTQSGIAEGSRRPVTSGFPAPVSSGAPTVNLYIGGGA